MHVKVESIFHLPNFVECYSVGYSQGNFCRNPLNCSIYDNLVGYNHLEYVLLRFQRIAGMFMEPIKVNVSDTQDQ